VSITEYRSKYYRIHGVISQDTGENYTGYRGEDYKIQGEI
jgi:hypothetical protein